LRHADGWPVGNSEGKAMTKRPSFQIACAQYVHRFTMQHIPQWARKPCEGNGKFYAPAYRTDAEWYNNTKFPGEDGHIGNRNHCFTTGQTWPLGQWLDKPYQYRA
jgi:hypothetical protein